MLNKKLWFIHSEPKIFFLIPLDAKFPHGQVQVSDQFGQTELVNEAWLLKFETTSSIALEYIQLEFKNILKQLFSSIDINTVQYSSFLDELPYITLSEANLIDLLTQINRTIPHNLQDITTNNAEGLHTWLTILESSLQDQSNPVHEFFHKLHSQLSLIFESQNPLFLVNQQTKDKYNKSARQSIAESLRRKGFTTNIDSK